MLNDKGPLDSDAELAEDAPGHEGPLVMRRLLWTGSVALICVLGLVILQRWYG